MLRLAFVLALLAAVPAAAQDEVRCTPDPRVELGTGDDQESILPESRGGDDGVTCRTSDGAIVPAHRSAAGTLTLRDPDGSVVYGQTDAQGVTTFRLDPPARLVPPQMTTAPDGSLRDPAGNVYNPPTDNMGNSTFMTEDGRVARCHEVGPGHTVCD